MWWLFIGLLLGLSVGWWYRLAARRRYLRVDDERQQLKQEKLILVEFIHSLVEATGEGLEREELFQRIARAAALSTNALSACLFELRPSGKLVAVAVEGLFPPQRPLPPPERSGTRAAFIEQVLKSEDFELGEGVVGTAAQSGKAILIEDASKDPRVLPQDDPSLQLRSLIAAPILFRKKVIGVLAVANPADGHAFSPTDLSLVQSLAEQAGLAIHNSDLMAVQVEKKKLDYDIAVASSVQAMLLPETFPQMPCLQIGAFYRPAQKIGGDLYDVIELDENRIAFAIADVSGKGVSASLLMAICQTRLRHYAKHHTSPADVMRNMNRKMVAQLRQDMFITLTYAIFDKRTNTLNVSRAGHELLLIVRPGDNGQPPRAQYVGGEGMAIGMVPSEVFDEIIEEQEVPFNPGDIAIFYTDGVTEASPANSEDEFGSARLAELICTNAERSAEEINALIVDSVEKYTKKQYFDDDLTLITLKHV